jgi:hypothetical protein
MAAITVTRKDIAASNCESVSQFTRIAQDNRAASAEEPARFLPTNSSLPPYDDEGTIFRINLYALCKVERKREAIAEALNYFDSRLIARRFSDCDRALLQLDVTRLASSVIVSILGITLRAKHLKCRAIFFERAMREIARQKGRQYARELLTKYR